MCHEGPHRCRAPRRLSQDKAMFYKGATDLHVDPHSTP